MVLALRRDLPGKHPRAFAQVPGWLHWRHQPSCAVGSERTRADAGFTLIELVVVCLLLPIVAGAITLALVLVLSEHNTVANRILNSTDAQVVSSNFEADVHSATEITTSTANQCGSGTPILSLRWNLDSAGNYQTTVSYVVQHNGTYYLARNYCVGGSSGLASPATSNEVAGDIPATQGPPVLSCTSSCTNAATTWIPAQGVTSVKLSITPPGSNYAYSLLADPAVNATDNPIGTQPTPDNSTCNFASPGTGTYASTLCFVDFTGFSMNAPGTTYCPGQGNNEIDAAVAESPFTLKFCVKVTEDTAGSTVVPSAIPTYTYTNYGNGDTSEAFLGNNGFYGGIPGEPALYQNSEGAIDTVNFTNIEVLGSNNNPASGWSLVTGDAESTDSGEGMIWTTCPSIPNTSYNAGYSACTSASAPPFTLLPNSSSSDFGNACHAPPSWNNFDFSGTQWTNILTGATSGTNTNTVECFATVDSDKTGTVMVSAPAPSTLTVYMQGAGLEAVFVGLLLS
jgi:hypothetical protein